ncbi:MULTISPECIES: DUF1128 family protein [Gracilibacillus]|uniref:DUF1128 domain-containing protein n=1 Tax=Gracilibacillus dipsosauri TaxID=178340 RepID=A0A317L4Z5_9BACI|nr:DUF1128 family protein [Gracilibacillus dipsosauri]PWU68899.1 DUF1128 domain-containing protein [Gracilibacillus dipsosauri]
MSLENKTEANFEAMIVEMSEKLQVVNRSIMDPKDYDIAYYEELKSLYDYLMQKGKLSVAETHAFIDELSQYRK